ncbi:hypothetical protein D9V84_11175 [Bacteroidetes/Chlorobi group bacterium Naka2016]|jgi:hypothetical protein|nr:MAG: hypothetical protein D9V84_11175 [Bacteroidetes/Chlorobi group bacterium Naka2016]
MSKLIQKVDPNDGKTYLGKIQLDELAPGLADKHYRHNQDLPALEWIIQHNLGKKPSVEVIDSAGTKVEGEIEYIDDNTVKIKFSSEFSGVAICN